MGRILTVLELSLGLASLASADAVCGSGASPDLLTTAYSCNLTVDGLTLDFSNFAVTNSPANLTDLTINTAPLTNVSGNDANLSFNITQTGLPVDIELVYEVTIVGGSGSVTGLDNSA